MANATISTERLKEEGGSWVDNSRKDDPNHVLYLQQCGFEEIALIKFFAFQREIYGDPYICTLHVTKLADGRVIADVCYADGIAGALFDQSEIDQFFPVLVGKHPELEHIDGLYGNYYHADGTHDEYWQIEYQIPTRS